MAMVNGIVDKSQVLIGLEQIYRVTDELSCICPHGCRLCEDRETLMLVPYEDELMGIENEQSRTFLRDGCGYCYQPRGYSCKKLHSSGICTIHKKRPFDCRSFPIVPRFRLDKRNIIDFYLVDDYCPMLNEVSAGFIKTTIECWQSIIEHLPYDWKVMYNHLNHNCYRKKITAVSGDLKL